MSCEEMLELLNPRDTSVTVTLSFVNSVVFE